MAKRKRSLTEDKISRWISEGRGQGHGIEYKPWLNIQDVPSNGVVSRIKSWTVGREHHLMSRLELNYFYVLDWSDRVVDIREQYPLLPLERTLEIAEELGIKHPEDPKTKEPIPITTDFMITIKENEIERFCARTIKPSSMLSKRTLEKFTIEKRYYDEEGIDWKIVTDRDIPLNLISNIEWLHLARELIFAPEGLIPRTIEIVAPLLLKELNESTDGLSTVALRIDDRMGLPIGSCMFIVQHFLATKRWTTDMTKKINPYQHVLIQEVSSTIGSSTYFYS